MKKGFVIAILFVLVMAVFSIANMVKVNHVGYEVLGAKKAVYVGEPATHFAVRSAADGDSVFGGELVDPKAWSPANEDAVLVDFTNIQIPGEYYVQVGSVVSDTFTVAKNAYKGLAQGVIKAFYYNRADMVLEEKYAGPWAREGSYRDSVAYYHASAREQSPWLEDIKEHRTPKGWYDAGDYGRYIINAGVSTYTLMALYEHYSAFFDTLTLDIPEQDNTIPDLLDEVRWNLEWMLAMQDPEDGGVFFKNTSANFVGEVMPEKAVTQRYLLYKSARSAYIFAGTMAQAARVFYKHDKEFAIQCATAADRAYNWGVKNWGVVYEQPRGISTGAYTQGVDNHMDELMWAAVELYTLNAEEKYEFEFRNLNFNRALLSWGSYDMASLMTISHHKKLFSEKAGAKADSLLISMANSYLEKSDNGYGLPFDEGVLYWGSNGAVSNVGVLQLQAYYLTNDSAYLNAAQDALDYIVGRNALDRSMVTGFGNRYPMHIHHRPSRADGVVEPVPGFVAGGPHGGGQDQSKCPTYIVPGAPAKSYIDHWCSYATNEIAINWNAPLAYLSGALSALYQGQDVALDWDRIADEFPINITSTPLTHAPEMFEMSQNGIHFAQATQGILYIYDLRGAILGHFTGPFNAGQPVQWSAAPGVYQAVLVHGSQVTTQKITVQK
jgi:endoglucanase